MKSDAAAVRRPKCHGGLDVCGRITPEEVVRAAARIIQTMRGLAAAPEGRR